MHAPAALRPLTRLAIRAAHRVQQQVAKEEQARLLAQFTTLDYQTGASMATQQPRVIDASSGLGNLGDPLEQLWNLPARRPTDYEGSSG
jgi:hypothetical protein